MAFLNSFHADLHFYPKIFNIDWKEGDECVVPDLHSHPLKLLHLLISLGIVIGIDAYDYDALVHIYNKKDWNSDDFSNYNQIIAKIMVRKDVKINLIGDELADRGSNDYFMLKLLEKLVDEKANLDIKMSNHTKEYFTHYEAGSAYDSSDLNNNGSRSMLNMHRSIEAGIFFREEVDLIVDKVYKKLNLLSYTRNTEGKKLTIYSHAPIGLTHIRKMANALNIKNALPKNGKGTIFNETLPSLTDQEMGEIVRVIDAVNEKFHLLFKTKTITRYSELKKSKEKFAAALEGIIWNRDCESIDRPDNVNFVNGHDPIDLTKYKNNPIKFEKYIKYRNLNLDVNNELGKFIEKNPSRLIKNDILNNRGTHQFITTRDIGFQKINSKEKSKTEFIQRNVNVHPSISDANLASYGKKHGTVPSMSIISVSTPSHSKSSSLAYAETNAAFNHHKRELSNDTSTLAVKRYQPTMFEERFNLNSQNSIDDNKPTAQPIPQLVKKMVGTTPRLNIDTSSALNKGSMLLDKPGIQALPSISPKRTPFSPRVGQTLFSPRDYFIKPKNSKNVLDISVPEEQQTPIFNARPKG